jgi:hypothetical protein
MEHRCWWEAGDFACPSAGGSRSLLGHGVWSSFELGVGTKLAMQVTLDWWNFEESVLGFFVHCIAITGLYMSVTRNGSSTGGR